MTDNRQRTVAEVRHIFSKRGGSLGEPNSVAWMFSKKGLITIEKSKVDEDTLMELVLNAGADDMQDANTEWEVHTSVEAFEAVREAIEKKGIPMLSAQVSMVPSTTIRIEDEDMANQVIKLMDALEDNDDVQHVYANFDIPDVILEKIGG